MIYLHNLIDVGELAPIPGGLVRECGRNCMCFRMNFPAVRWVALSINGKPERRAAVKGCGCSGGFGIHPAARGEAGVPGRCPRPRGTGGRP